MRGLPKSKIVQLVQGSFEYAVSGVGAPSVVLINGSGGPIEGWHKLFDRLAETSTTFAYNRPGLGRSTKPTRPQTAGAMVEDLRALLLAVRVPRPWLIAGHSFGGLIANLFARLHPQEVSGVILIEATAPEDVVLLRSHETKLQRALAWLANRAMPLHHHHEAVHAAQSAAEVAAAPVFPPIPLTVITGAKPAMAWASNSSATALRAAHQQALAKLSPHGRHIHATRSGHFPQFSEPDLVLSAIRKTVRSD
jgi:pimeloyl-ACP methyl ester carboxylesterase